MPLNPLNYSYKLVKPFAYENSTSPVGVRAHSNSTRNDNDNSNDTKKNFSFGSPIAAAINFATNLWTQKKADDRAERANKAAQHAAAEQANRAHAEALSARNWNSEQAQISRLKMAGLSPGLAYGSMSPVAAQAASTDKADVSKADTPNFDTRSLLEALDLMIRQQQANTAAAAQQSTSNLQASQTDLNLIDKVYRSQQFEADIANILASKDKSAAEKLEILTLLADRQRNIQSSTSANESAARAAIANAEVTEQTGVDLAKSQIASNKSSASLNAQQEKSLKLQYQIDDAQWTAVQGFMKEYGYGELLTPLVMKALSSIAESSGSTLSSVINNLSSNFGSIFNNFLGDLLKGDNGKKGNKR